MDKFNLTENEQVLYKSGKEDFIVTDKRLRKLDHTGKRKPFTSILLRNVTTIRVNYENRLEYIIYCVFLALLLYMVSDTQIINPQIDLLTNFSILFLIVWFVVKYFNTRIHQIEFRSSSGKIVITEKAIPFKHWDEIITQVEKAMLDFKKINSL